METEVKEQKTKAEVKAKAYECNYPRAFYQFGKKNVEFVDYHFQTANTELQKQIEDSAPFNNNQIWEDEDYLKPQKQKKGRYVVGARSA